MDNNTRGAIGLGTLILFIAMLLVAAVTASVLIQSTGSIQEKSMITGDQAREQISTNLQTLEVSARDGRDGNLSLFYHTIRLTPGSQPVALDNVLITLTTWDKTAYLTYAGSDASIEQGPSGYYVIKAQEMGIVPQFFWENLAELDETPPMMMVAMDLDRDGINNDTVVVCNAGQSYCDVVYRNGQWMMFNFTNGSMYYVQIVSTNGTAQSVCAGATSPLGNSKSPIGGLGYVTINGSSTGACRLPAGTIEVFAKEEEIPDMDGDGNRDYMWLASDKLIFVMNDSDVGDIEIPLGQNVSAGPVTIAIDQDLTSNGQRIGNVVLQGTTSKAGRIDSGLTFQLNPQDEGKGYYVGQYLQQGIKHIPGTVQVGDVVKLYYNTPRDILEDEELIVRVVMRDGTAIPIQVTIPEVLQDEKIYLYP